MPILTKNSAIQQLLVSYKKINLSIPFWNTYMAYAENQDKKKMLWYLKTIMVIPCVIMVPSIFLMAMITTSYIWFVALTMVLFFTNVIAHIAEVKSTLYVPLYHGSIFLIFLLPLIVYTITL